MSRERVRSARSVRPLSALTEGLPFRRDGAAGDPDVADVVLDSRRVAPGALFAALPGLRADGRDFVADAIARGAAAVVGPEPAPEACPVPYLACADPRKAVALLAARFADDPASRLVLCGVTGTSGKTTVATLIDAALAPAHPRRGLLGTIAGRGVDGVERAATHTTPEATDLCPFLDEIVRDGGTAATMEVSSHALALDRVAGLRFDAAAFTNLSRDHFDFHRDFEDYFAAKRRLFDLLKPGGVAVVNLDDAYGRRLAAELPSDVVRGVSLDGRAGAAYVGRAACTTDGIDLLVTATPGVSCLVRSPLLGRPNAENLLVAAATALALGVAPAAVGAALSRVARVRGRLERVADPGGVVALVDYAHKPAALEGVLVALRPLAAKAGGALRVVFGCGGDRDRGKRPEMGAIAARLADDVILTSDNPRSEDPERILEEIHAGVVAAGGRATRLVDRAAAIEEALRRSRPGDVLLVAGKGHETTQTTGDVVRPFDDAAALRAAIARRGVGAAGAS